MLRVLKPSPFQSPVARAREPCLVRRRNLGRYSLGKNSAVIIVNKLVRCHPPNGCFGTDEKPFKSCRRALARIGKLCHCSVPFWSCKCPSPYTGRDPVERRLAYHPHLPR